MTLPMNPHVPEDNSGNYLSQGFLLEIINSLPDPIFIKNREHRWTFANDAFFQFTGYNRKELIGKTDYDFFSTQEANSFWEKDESIFTSGISNNDELYFTNIYNQAYIISTKKSVFKDEFGNKFLIGRITKITATEDEQPQKENLNCFAESIIKATNSLFSTADLDKSFNAAMAALGSAADVEQIFIVNGEYEQKSGYLFIENSWEWSSNGAKKEFDICSMWYEVLSQGEIIAGSANDFIAAEQQTLDAANILTILVIPIQVEGDFWGYISFNNYQNERQWLDSEKSILKTAADCIGKSFYHYKLQQKIIEAKNFLQLVVDNIPQTIFWKDCNSIFLGCNQRLANIWGLSSVEEIAGKTDDEVSSSQEKSKWYREWDKRVINSGVPELHIIEKKQRANGKVFWLDTNKIPLRDAQDNVVGVLATIEDITERKQIEEALRQKEEFLRTIYDGVELGITVYEVTKDNNFRYFGINKATELVSSFKSQQMIGKSPQEVLGNELGRVIEQRNKDCLLNEKSISFEEVVKIKDKEIFLLTTLTPLRNEKGRIHRIISTSTNITAQKQAEATLRISEEKFQKLSKNVPGILYKLKIHPNGSMSFPYFSSGSYELLGIEAEEIKAESNRLFSMIHPDDYQIFSESIAISAEYFKPFYWEGRLITSSKKEQWVKSESRPEKQPDNSIIWDGFLTDITHLKQTEKALQKAYGEMESLVLERTKELMRANETLKAEIEERKSTEAALHETEAKVQKLAANVPGMLYQFQRHPDGSISFPYVSSGCNEIYGLQAEQIQANADTIISMIHPNDLKNFETSLAISARNLQPWEHEGRIVLASEKVKWIKSRSRPEKLENGTILWHGFILDITEHKQAEKALLRSNAMLQAQQEAAIDGILVVDENQEILSCNQHFVELWQIPQSAIETGNEKQLLSSIVNTFTNLGEFINEVEHLYNDAEKSIRDEIDLGDGRTFERYCAPVNSLKGEYFGRVWYFRDITERKEAEQSLLRTNSVLKAQQEASLDGILVVDEYRQSVSYNRRFIELWQITQSIIETGKYEQVFAAMLEKLDNPEEFISTVEYLFSHAGESCRNEIYLKNGKTFERYIASIYSLAGDNYGKIFYFRDITERKGAEAKLRQQTKELEKALLQLQRTQVQLIQSEKMSSLGQLVAGIAHEINNPVNFIDANLTYTREYFDDLLELVKIYQKNYPTNSEVEQFLEKIEFDYLQEDLPNIMRSMKTGAERISQIVLSLRTFSRLDEAEFKTIDINESIDSTLMILQNSLQNQTNRVAIMVTKEFDKLPLVECYGGKLNQVFLNILNNAIDALEEAIKNQQLPENEYPQIRIVTQLIHQDIVQISIIDNASGIPEENISRLFDPFFTTKPVGKGTGLGLSMSYQVIVEQHEGKLNCISTIGKGTEFQIQIPVSCKNKVMRY